MVPQIFLTAAFGFFEVVGPWIQKIGQFVFNAFVGAIDLAYQTYDGLRSLTGTIFGDKGVERFDEFSGVLGNVIAGAITLGTAMIMFSDDLQDLVVEDAVEQQVLMGGVAEEHELLHKQQEKICTTIW